jgi:Zn ribbon nucleic-acid-binding protein
MVRLGVCDATGVSPIVSGFHRVRWWEESEVRVASCLACSYLDHLGFPE